MFDDLRCPYCGYESDPCDFPDLFYYDCNMSSGLQEQLELLQRLQQKGFNIVTCGNCGGVFIHETKY